MVPTHVIIKVRNKTKEESMLLLLTIGSIWFAVTVVKSFNTPFGKSHYDVTEEEQLLYMDDEF
jgi:hypothetical protein